MVRDTEVTDQPRGNRAAAWLDPPRPIKQQHGTAPASQLMRGRCARRAAANDNSIVGFDHGIILKANAVTNMPMT